MPDEPLLDRYWRAIEIEGKPPVTVYVNAHDGRARIAVCDQGDGIKPEDGDVFEISAAAFGAPLRNPLKDMKPGYKPDGVKII